MTDLKEIMFSSKTDLWSTPQDFYDKLYNEFHFDLDPCSTDDNCKCTYHFTEKENGLLQDWSGHIVFCNPPYGRKISQWVKKAYDESQKDNTIVVMLIPARTDTSYFHEFIYNKSDIRFVRGRLKFGNSKNCAPFPSMVVVFK